MDFIVDFLIVAVFALCIFVGVKNGLIRSIIGLVVVAAAAALAVWLSEPVASGIYDLFIKKSLETAVAAQLPGMSSAQLTSQNVQEVISSLPAAIVKAAQSIAAISEKAGSVDLSASNIAAEICDSVAKPIAVAVLKVLSFAVIFFVCDFFLQIAAKAVCKLFELPVIRSVNRTLGGVFGALKGVFVAVFACLLLDAAASFAPGTQFASAVGASKLVSLIVSTDIFSRLITV